MVSENKKTPRFLVWLKGIFAPGRPYFWMVIACAVWLFTFRDYFTGRTTLFSDATSYFDHTRFFLENLKKGVFPLWDYFWNHGSSNEFFLRRLGAYNPIYLWMLVLKSVGFSDIVT